MYVREVELRYRLRRVCGKVPESPRVTSPAIAARLFVSLLGREVVEVCGLLALSTRSDVIAYHEVSRGTLDHTLVFARDVFRAALLTQAVAVVVGHNHPSGHATPSADDLALTRRLAEAGRLIGVDLADHIIVTPEHRYFSFKEAGQL